MNKDKVLEIYKMLYKSNYNNVIGALLLFELETYEDVLKLDDNKMKQLEDTYREYMRGDLSGFINEDLKDIYGKNGVDING